MNERDIGDVARHQPGNIEFELERYDAFDRIGLVGLGVEGAKTTISVGSSATCSLWIEIVVADVVIDRYVNQ
jgi:hypothetical protein